MQFLPFHLHIKMIIVNTRWEIVGEASQLEIMRGNDADGLVLHQLPDQGLGAFMPVGRVGAAQDLIQQNKNGLTVLHRVDDAFEFFQFGVEGRGAFLQVIGDAHAAHDAQGGAAEAGCANGRAHIGQHHVHAHAAQEGGLAGHVGAGDDIDLGSAEGREAVEYGFMGVDQRMAEIGGGEFGLIGLDGGVAPVGVVEGEGAEAAEGLEFGEGMEPGYHLLIVAAFPSFQLEGLLEVPEEEGIQRDEDNGVEPIVEPVEDLVQGFDGLRCAGRALLKILGEGIEQRIPERSAFNAGDAIGKGLHFRGNGIELHVEGVNGSTDRRCDDEEQYDAREELLERDDIEHIGEGEGHGQDGDEEADGFPDISAEAIGFIEPGFDGFFRFDGQLRSLAMGLELLPPEGLGGEFLHGFLPR